LREGDAIVTRGFEILQDQSPIAVVFEDEVLRPESNSISTPEEAETLEQD
jgi:hypothetical protein